MKTGNSIRQKLTLIITMTSGIALVLACSAFMAHELLTYRAALAEGVDSLAGIVGTNCTAAIAFNDPKAAEETLAALRREQDILSAAIYAADGSRFAAYRRPGPGASPPPAVPGPDGTTFHSDRIVLFRGIEHDGRRIGTVCIQQDLAPVRARLVRYGLITVLVLLAALGTSFWIASRLQRVISHPILRLAETARRVSSEKDYAVRADAAPARDELGVLVDTFNEMLEQIQRRDAELQKAHDELEARVAERTRALQDEIGVRERAESELKVYMARLERSNKELQDFAHVASHDLQEPLRKVQAFGDRLKMKCADALGEEGRDYLDRMQGAASRMSTLIHDLLTFSRVTTKAQPFTRVDLGVVAREVLGDLEIRIEQSGGRVEVSGLPTIEADPVQMRQLLQNLIGNALKFHRPGVPPVVRVTGEILRNGAEAPRCRIAVEDNGIGFEARYRDRLFNVFQRLHARSEYEGTGIGLAVCRKIVERHGGTIDAESRPGEGSRFTAILPLRQVSREERP